MSNTAPDNLLRRVRYTPLADLLRGRVTARLDVKTQIETSELPREIKNLVWKIVKRTRLWTSEKVEVAHELIAHFEDGITAGESPPDLITQFGDTKSAAKLIRRAKRRGRPLAWHVLRAIGSILMAIIVIYAFLTARFLLSHPTVKVDYLDAMNRRQLSVGESDRGWPIYREAILALGSRPHTKERDDALIKILDARPGSKYWSQVAPWLREHEKLIELIRKAAAKPVLGFIIGENGSMKDPQLYPTTILPRSISTRDQPMLSVYLPHLNDLRELANVLATDFHWARENGDAARALSDVEAIGNLARQLHKDSEFLLIDHVAIGIWGLQLNCADELIADEKLKPTNDDLQKLAHLLAWPRVAGDILSFKGERMMVHDAIQRAYTDDGNGDGHLTLEGQKLLREIGAIGSWNLSGYSAVFNSILEYASAPVGSSRKAVTEQYDRLMDLADANVTRPIREANWQSYTQQSIAHYDQSTRLRRSVLILMERGLAAIHVRAERNLGHRDGILVAIALELHRREHGQYPKTLDELSPKYLPTLPPDRINGAPLKWRLINGKPLIYSVGADGDDDGGRLPIAPGGKVRKWGAADWSSDKPADGDWVLFPMREEKPDEG
jgi:hypothetical protein